MKIAVINGSPKGKYSITLKTVEYLMAKYPGHSFSVIQAGERIKAYEKDFSEAEKVLFDADAIVFSYPVYTFLAPSQLHRFIELVKENGSKLPTVHYQPQYNKYNICIGAESLVYWNHSVYGNVYPPLIFKLAEETDMLIKYEKDVFRAVVRDMDKLSEILGSNAKISINVTGKTIQTDEYEEFLLRQSKKYPSKIGNIMIEVTEQAALEIDDKLIERLTRIKNMGYRLAIDDFTMGSTSVKYLQTNIFSLLKLDGQISKGVMDNDRNIEIIASITKLAHDFGIDVLAEYVESEEQKKILEVVGCNLYQGYLYGTAVPIDELAKQIEN